MIKRIQRLFVSPETVRQSAPARTNEPMLSFGAAGDRFVRIASFNFFGQYRRSPDGRWLLAWRDGNDAGAWWPSQQRPGTLLYVRGQPAGGDRARYEDRAEAKAAELRRARKHLRYKWRTIFECPLYP